MHSIVFGGYSADSLAARILDAGARVLITADGVYRGTKLIKLLEIAHHAMDKVIRIKIIFLCYHGYMCFKICRRGPDRNFKNCLINQRFFFRNYHL